MPRLIWSPAALEDIARLHVFLKPKSPDAATRTVRTIRQGVRLLAAHPQAGPSVDDMPPEYRQWPIDLRASGYVVLYRHDGGEVVILAVRHAREAGY
jgi:plasmid stabilization system protein ParE